MPTLLDAVKNAKRQQRISETRHIANNQTYTDHFEPEFDKLLGYYNDLLVQATLSSEPLDYMDPITGAEGKVSPSAVAARIEGIKFAKDFMKKLIKEVERNEVKIDNAKS